MTTARDLSLRLAELLRREHSAMAEFLVALADFDRRRAWLEMGHANLFSFLHRELGLSTGAAYVRKVAAGLVDRHPEILDALRTGKLCLSTVSELAKVVTPENLAEVLPRFLHRSKKEAAMIVAELQPVAAPHRDVVTPIRASSSPRGEAHVVAAAASAPSAPTLVSTLAAPLAPALARNDPGQAPFRPDERRDDSSANRTELPPTDTAPPPSPAPRPRQPDEIVPLNATLSRYHVTGSRRFLDKLEKARAALSRSHPGASSDELLEAGLDLLLDRHAKRNGVVKKPRPVPPPSSDPEHVPAHVRRAVWERDGGRCQHPLASGGACGSTVRVELHHRRSRHRGGPPTVENLTTLCGFHHDRETRREFGDDLVDRMVRGARGRGGPATDAAGERPS